MSLIQARDSCRRCCEQVVVARQKIPTQELDKLCLDNIARFKRPREYRFVEALPKNNYGKILKTELRKLLTP